MNHENVETCEKGHPSNPEPNQRKMKKSRQDEIKIFTDALKRLVADYPPPESASPSNSVIVTSDTCTQRINGDNNERPLPRVSHTARSLSIRSHPTAVNSDRNSTHEAQGRPSKEQELTAAISCEDHKHHGRNTVEHPQYEDKGVMVSRWMHQGAKENISYGKTIVGHQPQPRRVESSNSRAGRNTYTTRQTPPLKQHFLFVCSAGGLLRPRQIGWREIISSRKDDGCTKHQSVKDYRRYPDSFHRRCLESGITHTRSSF